MLVNQQSAVQEAAVARQVQSMERGVVFIFSSDNDLAISLTMLLEDRFTTVMETDSRNFLQHVRTILPAVLLVDLPSAPGESLRQIVALYDVPEGIPLILLRNYRSSPDMTRELVTLGAHVFFKPVDVEKLGQLITRLLEEQRQSNGGDKHGTDVA
ncbi:MAG TPA: hypothetical protein VII11_05450 [Bacteroidota bacterium]